MKPWKGAVILTPFSSSSSSSSSCSILRYQQNETTTTTRTMKPEKERVSSSSISREHGVHDDPGDRDIEPNRESEAG